MKRIFVIIVGSIICSRSALAMNEQNIVHPEDRFSSKKLAMQNIVYPEDLRRSARFGVFVANVVVHSKISDLLSVEQSQFFYNSPISREKVTPDDRPKLPPFQTFQGKIDELKRMRSSSEPKTGDNMFDSFERKADNKLRDSDAKEPISKKNIVSDDRSKLPSFESLEWSFFQETTNQEGINKLKNIHSSSEPKADDRNQLPSFQPAATNTLQSIPRSAELTTDHHMYDNLKRIADTQLRGSDPKKPKVVSDQPNRYSDRIEISLKRHSLRKPYSFNESTDLGKEAALSVPQENTQAEMMYNYKLLTNSLGEKQRNLDEAIALHNSGIQGKKRT